MNLKRARLGSFLFRDFYNLYNGGDRNDYRKRFNGSIILIGTKRGYRISNEIRET